MFATYYVKQDLPGLPKGSVERFSLIAGARWQQEGAVEPFDEKNKTHVSARERLESEARRAHAAETAKLEAERKRKTA